MRRAILVMCQFTEPEEFYTDFKEEIRRAPRWWHHIKGVWILISNETAEVWSDRLIPHVRPGDRLLVMTVRVEETEGKLADKSWAWLINNLH